MDKYKNKLIKFYKSHRRLPSYSEMMSLFNYHSKNSVFRLVQKLIADGFIIKDSSGHLIPRHLFGQVKVLGQVEAGFPSPSEEELSDTMSIDEYLIANKEATFMLKVSGDSMKDAGIMPGDIVLVQRNITPHDGDIVIAEVDNNWTIKYFRQKGNQVSLEPANNKFKTIRPSDSLNIAAVVTGVVRKY
ncbi:MAG: repressor LexA [Parcubacteria group bacterium]|nr:MAG: repressor LexA [Parcubacteria group bacterium]